MSYLAAHTHCSTSAIHHIVFHSDVSSHLSQSPGIVRSIVVLRRLCNTVLEWRGVVILGNKPCDCLGCDPRSGENIGIINAFDRLFRWIHSFIFNCFLSKICLVFLLFRNSIDYADLHGAFRRSLYMIFYNRHHLLLRWMERYLNFFLSHILTHRHFWFFLWLHHTISCKGRIIGFILKNFTIFWYLTTNKCAFFDLMIFGLFFLARPIDHNRDGLWSLISEYLGIVVI